ncbi:MAG: type II toxin-antitoxin system RelE/ParE family toxin, partial [Spirochaetota bacterium]|nr:type II toxin-antitoxin system RelE/ParE family toxin [Spirochaetota bacterium]
LDVYFASRKDEVILTNERLRKSRYGQIADSIGNRLAEFEAANSLEEIPVTPPPRRHKLSGSMANYWSVDVSRNYRIIFVPYGTWSEQDISSITKIKILQICDYH